MKRTGTCRACGRRVALRFVPGDREEGRQSHWIGECDCGSNQPVVRSCPDYYGKKPRK